MRGLKTLRISKKGFIIVIVLVSIIWVFTSTSMRDEVTIDYSRIESISSKPLHYQNVLASWQSTYGMDDIHRLVQSITDETVSGEFYGIDRELYLFNNNQALTIEIEVSQQGMYHIAIDQLDVGASILSNRLAIKINGETQHDPSNSIDLPTEWVFSVDQFPLDRYGNEVLPNSVKRNALIHSYLYDSTGLNADPLLFKLEAGINTIELIHVRGSFVMSDFYLISPKDDIDYEAYLGMHKDALLKTQITQVIGAESFTSKTNPSTRLRSERDPASSNYDTRYLRLNAIDGYSFRKGNDVLTYTITVEEAGLYHLGFKVRQNYLQQMPVFREVRINDVIPFDAMRMVPFHYSNDYTNFILGNGVENYQFYLEAGENTVALRVVLEPYRDAYTNVTTIMSEITDLSLEIKKLTGNTSDRYRTWQLETYIPNIDARLERWITTLEQIDLVLSEYSYHNNPAELTNIRLAVNQLNELKEDINDIPNKMLLLADGDASTAQLLGATAQVFLENGLDIEAIYVTGDDHLPKPNANLFLRTFETVKRFILSFTTSDYQVDDVDDQTLEIWVNYPRQYVEIMQQIIDSEFTQQTGIPVQLSVMPDENKLILANAAGRAPDIALGVNHWLPYEFAIRGASLDLRQFDGYETVVNEFAPGVMIPYVFEDGMYGLPLTQNFWVTFYRTDIMESLNIPVPDTWNEVIEILPEMQRYGLNYFQPISQFRGFKPFVVTIPFIYQFGGDLYSEDGMSTQMNSEENLEGIQMMTELFTIYNVPKEVPSFYNHFRNGLLPIGIGDLATYLQLTIAAPEIAGKWDIAPHPGVMNDAGEIVRYAASGAQSSMIMSSTSQPQESWDFIAWWMSTQVQINFAMRLQTTYGTEFLWNTANLEAFAQLPLPQNHIDVILKQWEYAIEASRIPGAYMVERELSNAWNKIVFDDTNPRVTLDNAVKIANREIAYRMEEFGYVENNQILKPYRVPTIYNIQNWLKEHDND